MSASEKPADNTLPFPKSGPFILVDLDIQAAVDKAIERLPRLDTTLYQRDGELVEVVRVPQNENEDAEYTGAPRIRSLPKSTLRERLSHHLTFTKPDARTKSGYRFITPPDEVVTAIMQRGEKRGFPPLAGVLEAPAMRSDGSIIQEPNAYDDTTGYLYMPNVSFPVVPNRPTQADARRCLTELAEVFADFPYASEAHRSVPVAAVLTVLARPAIDGCTPAFISDAPTPGTGKTLETDAIATITTGRGTAKMTFPDDDAELEKVLGSCALQGTALLNFDNLTRTFGGGPLDRVLTARDRVQLRILGRSEAPSLAWKTIVFATGCNVAIARDTSRRCVVSRLESPMERPEEREGFKHFPLLPWVLANRPRLVVAALTVLRAWHVAGRPRGGCATWGSFEEWSSMIPAAIVFAGGADPLSARPVVTGSEDTETAALRTILADWPRLAPGGLTAKAAITALYPQQRESAAPDGFNDLRDAIESLVFTPTGRTPSAIKLAGQLRRFKQRVVGGQFIDGTTDRKGVVVWCVKSAGVAGVEGLVSNLRVEISSDKSGEGNVKQASRPQQPRHGEVGS